MIPADMDKTRQPGYSSVNARCTRRWAAATAASTRGFAAKGALMAVSTFRVRTMGRRMSTPISSRISPPTAVGTKPCRVRISRT